MKFPSIKNLFEGIISTVKRFPFETLFALCGAVAGTLYARSHDYGSIYNNNCIRTLMMANLGLLLCFSASLFAESRGMTGFGRYGLKLIAALVAVPLYWLLNPMVRDADVMRFFMLSFGLHLLVAFAAFTQKGQMQGFWQFNKTIFLRFLTGLLYSTVLYLGLLAAITATKYLFNVHWSEDIYMELWVWIVCVFNTLFFLGGVPSDFKALDEDESYPKGLKIFTQYVLIPLATIYVIILLAYEVKILIEWRLPKGWTSNLIIGYAEFGLLSILLVYPIREKAGNKWLKIYARYFYVLLIPLIILLFLAVFARVKPYGVTPERYMLIVLAVWLIFITAYFLLSKKQSIKVIPASLCVLTLLSTYGPQSAFPVSNWSQAHILLGIFKKYDAFHDGKLQPIKKKLSDKDGTNAAAKLYYLTENDAWDILQPYTSFDLKAVNDSLANKLNSGTKERYKYIYTLYNLRNKRFEWIRRKLGLKNFSQYGPDAYEVVDYEDDTDWYHFSTGGQQPMKVVDNDYAISIDNDYASSPDTSVDHTTHIQFIRWKSGGEHFLSVNGEKASFDLKSLAKKLCEQAVLKKYKENKNYSGAARDFAVDDSLLTLTSKTEKYQVTLKLTGIRAGIQQKDVSSVDEIFGYYLIKVKK